MTESVTVPAAETGAAIELCHVQLAVQTDCLSSVIVSVWFSQACNLSPFFVPRPNIHQSCFFLRCALVIASQYRLSSVQLL